MRYPGGKGKSFQHVINIMPPHETYIETHLGGGAVMRNKKSAIRNIGIDVDQTVISRWKNKYPFVCELINSDAIGFMKSYAFSGNELIYSDPPYLKILRKKEYIYKHDYQTKDHETLLKTLLKLPCCVIISGYDSELYNDSLASWSKKTFNAKTHTGLREECLWFNYTQPTKLHDVKYLGTNFRERQNIKRKFERIQQKVTSMTEIERNEFIAWITSTYSQGSHKCNEI